MPIEQQNGGAEETARLLIDLLNSEEFGQPSVVENLVPIPG
ncbi:hypothetical protein [Bacillus mojavensis]|nr:hypothetical protein [Bacillus mojavensis]MEC1666194.1 hypothetical protein [Bacillus mojavensis]